MHFMSNDQLCKEVPSYRLFTYYKYLFIATAIN